MTSSTPENKWFDPTPRCPHCDLPWISMTVPTITDDMIDKASTAFVSTPGDHRDAMRAAVIAALKAEVQS